MTEEQPNVMEGTKCRVCGEGELVFRARWIGCDREDRENVVTGVTAIALDSK